MLSSLHVCPFPTPFCHSYQKRPLTSKCSTSCNSATGHMTSHNRHGTKTTPFLVHSAVSLMLHGSSPWCCDHTVTPVGICLSARTAMKRDRAAVLWCWGNTRRCCAGHKHSAGTYTTQQFFSGHLSPHEHNTRTRCLHLFTVPQHATVVPLYHKYVNS
jgi:hypothetical protein